MVVTTRKRKGKKEQTPKKTKTEQQEVDRISELPDDILHAILSLLTIKEACITSALSRRWRHLFPTLPRLDLCYFSFRYSWPQGRHGIGMDCWLESVRDVLESRRSAVRICTIRSFDLHDYSEDLGNVIRFLCNDGIQELTLNSVGLPLYTVPSCLYFCRTLTRIELCHCILKVPSNFSLLRRLTTLRIQECTVDDGDMRRLMLGCRAVERLTLDHCHILRNLAVDSPKLAVLNVNTGTQLAVSIVNAPRLESVTVLFYYYLHTGRREGHDGEGECSRLMGLLESLGGGNIQSLSLGKDTYLEGMAAPVNLQSPLTKMKKLTLLMRPGDALMFSVVSCLLNSCPNLQDLVIGDSVGYEWQHSEASMLGYWDHQIPSDCIRNSLSTATVVLNYTVYWECWIKFAKFLLNNACVLKNLVIDCNRDPSKLRDLLLELLLLRRASPDAVVELKAHPC